MATAHSTRIGISSRQRARMSQLVDEVRELRRLVDVEPCVYCGVAANSVDHVPPRAARDRIVSLGLAHRYPFHEVPACRECNSVLGARGLWTLTERRDYIKKALRRRYSDILRIPDWSDSELAQVSPAMRGYILDGLYVRDFVKARVAYQQPMLRTA
jgi:hypothetical protein